MPILADADVSKNLEEQFLNSGKSPRKQQIRFARCQLATLKDTES